MTKKDEQREDWKIAEKILDSLPSPRGSRDRSKKVEPDSNFRNLATGFFLGMIFTFLLFAVINVIAMWFGANPVFTNGVVSPLIIAIGGIIGAWLRSARK